MVPSTISIPRMLCPSHREFFSPLTYSILIDRSDHFIEYLLERKDVVEPWRQHTEHDFLKQVADGTLPVDKFKVYLIQDYLYLVSKVLL